MRTVETLRHRMIRCILFDLGDTLGMGAYAETWEPLLQAADLTPSIQAQNFHQAAREARWSSFSHHPGYEPTHRREYPGRVYLPAICWHFLRKVGML